MDLIAKPKKLTPLGKLIHENTTMMREVEAVDIRYLRPSSDLHTNVWGWTCGCCGHKGNPDIDTMYRTYSTSCNKCLATNTFDFRKHGA